MTCEGKEENNLHTKTVAIVLGSITTDLQINVINFVHRQAVYHHS